MESDKRQKVIKQIRVLLAKGDSSEEEEARTSLFIAHKLMRENELSYADVVLSDHMREIGRRGGHARAQKRSGAELSRYARKGVAERRRKLSAAKRIEIATKASQARWAKR